MRRLFKLRNPDSSDIQVTKRFINTVDEDLMQRLDAQRERLRMAGVQVTPLLRVRQHA